MASALRFLDAAKLVADHRDILDGRAWNGAPPAALERRGWAEFLLGLDDGDLVEHETRGLEANFGPSAPGALAELVETSRRVSALPELAVANESLGVLRRRETPRKRRQVDAFAKVIRTMSSKSDRFLDFGSGHGHLTREIAEHINRPVIGLEREPRLAERARALSAHEGPTFVEMDVGRGGLALRENDCAMGLHACGELGDFIVETAASVGASVALVGCCLQKRRADSRLPLAAEHHFAGLDRSKLELPRALLGLSNLTARESGVERSRAENLAGRCRRLALHRLLASRGLELRPGAELEGLNRRVAHADLGSIVARAFDHRGLARPSDRDIDAASKWAMEQHGRARRLSLPRAHLARVVEVFVLLDRAVHLEDHGYKVTVGTVFPAAVSARNLAVVGEPP